MMCFLLGVRHFIRTAYCPQTNGNSERFHKTIFLRFLYYVVEHQKDGNSFVQPLLYSYNTQNHPSINQTPFSFVINVNPPGLLFQKEIVAILSDARGEPAPQVLRARLKARIRALQAKVDAHTRKVQHRYK